MPDDNKKRGGYFSIDFSWTPEERIEAIWNDLADDPDYFGFDTRPLQQARLLSAGFDEKTGYGKSLFEVTISPAMCNKTGMLHGGAACTIMDTLTSTPLMIMAKPGFLDAGHVSRTITMSYLRPVPSGMKVTIECTAMAVGKTTANIVGVMKNPEGKVCVTCIHDKAVFTTRRFNLGDKSKKPKL